MKTFKIGVSEEIGGYVTIKARTKAKAEKIVKEIVEYNGLDGVKGVDITHRDVVITA